LEESLKRRLVGGAVLVSLVVIFVPMLVEEPEELDQTFDEAAIPEKPEVFRKPLKAMPQPTLPPVSEARKEQKPAPAKQPTGKRQEKKEPRSTVPTAWIIRVGSFAKKANATKLVKEMGAAGIKASIESVTIAGKRHYRVQMFPRLDKRSAEKLLIRIRKDFVSSAKLEPYSGK
jgi:DedD protein